VIEVDGRRDQHRCGKVDGKNRSNMDRGANCYSIHGKSGPLLLRPLRTVDADTGRRQWRHPAEYAIAGKLKTPSSGTVQMTGFADKVSAAAAAVRELFPPTPLQENSYLSRKTGAHIFLKREDLSPVRSYKIRGAFNFFRKTLAAGNQAEL